MVALPAPIGCADSARVVNDANGECHTSLPIVQRTLDNCRCCLRVPGSFGLVPPGRETEKTLSPLLDLAKECQLIDEDIELAFRANLVDPIAVAGGGDRCPGQGFAASFRRRYDG